MHKKSGEALAAEHEYGPAYRQFRLASLRQPSDKVLLQNVTSSWASYSREVALDRQKDRKQLTVGQREILNQAIQFAVNYKAENKLDLAYKSIRQAEDVDPDSLQMLQTKAEILGAQSEFAKAFDVLDRYDLHAVEEEREKASRLRNDLLFKQTSTIEDVKEQIKKAITDGNFVQVHELAMKGLRASNDDPELLYQAATASIISRETQKSHDMFVRYLTITNTLDANPEQRTRVRTLLASSALTSGTSASAESGQRNWLSGKKLPDNVFYCPISLAFQPRIDHIDASGKMKVAYEWNGDQLLSITPTFEKAEKSTGERKITFAYNTNSRRWLRLQRERINQNQSPPLILMKSYGTWPSSYSITHTSTPTPLKNSPAKTSASSSPETNSFNPSFGTAFIFSGSVMMPTVASRMPLNWLMPAGR